MFLSSGWTHPIQLKCLYWHPNILSTLYSYHDKYLVPISATESGGLTTLLPHIQAILSRQLFQRPNFSIPYSNKDRPLILFSATSEGWWCIHCEPSHSIRLIDINWDSLWWLLRQPLRHLDAHLDTYNSSPYSRHKRTSDKQKLVAKINEDM